MGISKIERGSLRQFKEPKILRLRLAHRATALMQMLLRSASPALLKAYARQKIILSKYVSS